MHAIESAAGCTTQFLGDRAVASLGSPVGARGAHAVQTLLGEHRLRRGPESGPLRMTCPHLAMPGWPLTSIEVGRGEPNRLRPTPVLPLSSAPRAPGHRMPRACQQALVLLLIHNVDDSCPLP